MSEVCPLCGATMLDDTLPFSGETRRCVECAYWEERMQHEDGTLITVVHRP